MAILLAGTAFCGPNRATQQPQLFAEPWPEAEAMFTHDPYWLGGDAVYSIDLGKGRVLWLFGDSFIGTTSARLRSQAAMVNNSLAIQTGYDVRSASMKFYWKGPSTAPSSFFPPPSPSTFYWPAHGARVGHRLILFLWVVKHTDTGLGFAGVGWNAVAIENPDADPSQWTVTPLATSHGINVSMGSAVLVSGQHLYAFTTGLTQSHPTYLARWPLRVLSGNTLANPEWFTGAKGWARESRLSGLPSEVANVNQSEFNVYPALGIAPYLMIQTSGFGAATLAYQTGKELVGSFSGPTSFYFPPERTRPGIMIYSAKMHPMLFSPGYDVIASYSTNSTKFSTLVSDMSLYFPKFVRAKWVKR